MHHPTQCKDSELKIIKTINMEIKILKQWKLVKGTGDNQKIGVPYKTEKGYTMRWVEKPNKGQWDFIKHYIENEPKPKPKGKGEK